MKAIVCADKNWGIGKGSGMLYHIPADLKFFKEKTTGNTIVMGYATFLSLPGQKALPNRRNIVLYDGDDFSAPDVTVCRSLDELGSLIEDGEEVFITGGQSVYEQTIDLCDTAYVTRVDAEDKDAEKFFPNLDEREGWELKNRSEVQESNGYRFTFDTYVRVK